MKILQLCKKMPYPLKDGEAIAVTYLAKALHQLGAELTLLSMNTTKHPVDVAAHRDALQHYEAVHTVAVDNRVNAKDAFLNLFTNQSYHIARFVSAAFEEKLIALLTQETFDVVQLETLYLAPYIPTIRAHSKAKIVLRSHNVEHEIWKRITQNTSLGPKKWYLQLLTQRLEQFERNNLNNYDLLVAITQRDLDFFQHLGCTIPTHVSPIGLDLAAYDPQPLPQPLRPTFGFIGSLDWWPNTEGIDWLLQQVWPEVLKALPQAELHLAGRNATPAWSAQIQQHPQVVVHGEVPSAPAFIQEHAVMLVPLFSGSGMRVKILEGMALGKTIISTSLGLEGIQAASGREVWKADTAADFAAAMVRSYQMPAVLETMGQRAIQFIERHYDNYAIGQQLLSHYHQLLKRQPVNSSSSS